MKRATALIGALLLTPGTAFAGPSPFGIATPDGGGALSWAGPFRGFFVWIAAEQSSFYRELTGALSELSQSSHAAWFLIGLSFAYGVFHAVGPGHGKAVIASYLLATGDTLKRGIAISFASGFVQGLTAIIVVGIGTILLKVTAVTMTRATDALEIASYAMIALCGVWLLWSKTVGRHDHGSGTSAATAPHVHDAFCAIHGHNRLGLDRRSLGQQGLAVTPTRFGAAALGQPRLAYGGFSATAATASVDLSCDCGHAHIPDPATLTSPLTLRSGIAAILAVGIRPCSGAVIVLVFALAQQLWWAGILSVLAMSLGTGATVAALAILAVKAKDIAVRFTGDGRSALANRVLRGFELAAAAGILLFGLAMLGGALASG
ncbi:ABC-type nickel/cobalt efflux system, permease component RcnA [Kaistia soli DSM 19436]|uniref:Nickel/cobalt efflux system n=1 Tax=Kaistia soli DSM 19436 TaxID=1122133 RepID=A0A1M5JDC9_9HYPH|nr:nickel/cobalt transporter [Kaistia soli]SHG38385.1 ABC-type nickel/cobalt efflux system, permease component RcnA [Kaistia soli DSM 19436]